MRNKIKQRNLSRKNFNIKLERKDHGKKRKISKQKKSKKSHPKRRNNWQSNWKIEDIDVEKINTISDTDLSGMINLVGKNIVDEVSEDEDQLIHNSENDDNESNLYSIEQKHIEKQKKIRKIQEKKKNKKRCTEESYHSINDDVEADEEEVGEEEVDNDECEMSEFNEEDSTTNVVEEFSNKSFVDIYVQRKFLVEKLKEKFALIGNSVMTHPVANIDKLKKIFKMLDITVNDPKYGIVFFTAQKLALQSLNVIFNDIIPNYRVAERFNFKDNSVDEGGRKGKNAQLKKDTLKTYVYEKTLLKYYQLYLQRLQRVIDAELGVDTDSNFYKVMLTTRKARSRLAVVACDCLSELLAHHYNFNCRSRVISLLAQVLCNTNHATDNLRNTCSKAFEFLFKEDLLGEASIESVNFISKFVVKYNFRVYPVVFRTFLHLNFRDISEEVASTRDNLKDAASMKKDRKLMSKKEKKRAKHMQKLERQLLEVEAVESKANRLSLKSQMHKALFGLYFRFLKRCIDISTVSFGNDSIDMNNWYRPLFPDLLEGIGKFSVYLNDVFIYTVIDALRRMIEAPFVEDFEIMSDARLTSVERLCCLRTIFQIMSYSGNLLSIDFQNLYIILFELAADPLAVENSLDVLVMCVEEMILKRSKQIPWKRIISFVQRFVLLLFNLNGPEAVAMLIVIKKIFQQLPIVADFVLRHDDSEQGLDKFPDMPVDPDSDATQGCNVLYNLSLLADTHCDLYVRYLACSILHQYSNSHNRSENIFENRNVAKKMKELNLIPEVCQELIKTNDPLHGQEISMSSDRMVTMLNSLKKPWKYRADVQKRTSGGSGTVARPKRRNKRRSRRKVKTH